MGRGIRVQDASTAPPVTVVNQSFVKSNSSKTRIRSGAGLVLQIRLGISRLWALWKIRPTLTVRWKNHSMFFVPIMHSVIASDKEPMENDMSLYAGAIDD